MTSSLLAMLISQLLLNGASAAECVGDETCLMQTKADIQIRRHSGEEPVIENQREPKSVPEFTIDLNEPPEKRFSEISKHFKKGYAEFYAKYGHSAGIQASVKKVAELRGEESPEMMGEIRGIAKDTGLPEFWIQGSQLIPTLACLKGPFLKFVDDMNVSLPSEELLDEEHATSSQMMNHFQVPSFGNTGIIAKDKDGSVWHMRNLGYAMPRYVQANTYNAKFIKDGNELYTAQMIFPLTQPFTAIRKGKNGYTWQANTRYLNQREEGMELMKNLYMERRQSMGWTARKILEKNDNYEDAVKAFSQSQLPNPEYLIMTGVKKGVVIARDPEGVAYQLDLDDEHPYVVMTNFDYTKGDKKEWLQPTREKGVSPRVRAQSLLEGKEITPEVLEKVINDRDVLSKNVLFQAMMNVEHNRFDTVLPRCANCD